VRGGRIAARRRNTETISCISTDGTDAAMKRQELMDHLLAIFAKEFEIENPGLDEDLREEHEFDSIDAITLLQEIEIFLGTTLTQKEKKGAMEIRTLNQICDYVERMAAAREMNS
jgi:acyl carrier protein